MRLMKFLQLRGRTRAQKKTSSKIATKRTKSKRTHDSNSCTFNPSQFFTSDTVRKKRHDACVASAMQLTSDTASCIRHFSAVKDLSEKNEADRLLTACDDTQLKYICENVVPNVVSESDVTLMCDLESKAYQDYWNTKRR